MTDRMGKVDGLDVRQMYAPCHDLEGDPCLTSCTQIQDFLVFSPAPPPIRVKSRKNLCFLRKVQQMEYLGLNLVILRGNLEKSIDRWGRVQNFTVISE